MMVKFLLDENVPLSVLRLLRRKGYTADRPRDLGLSRATNSQLAEHAIREDSVIITLDEDFLRLRAELLREAKVVFVKLHPRDTEVVVKVVDDNMQGILSELTKRNVVVLTKEGVQPQNI